MIEIHLNAPCSMLNYKTVYNFSVFIGYSWGNLCHRHYFSTCIRGKFQYRITFVFADQ